VARFVDAIDLPLLPEAAFDLLANFGRLPAWDPSAFEARRLDRGLLGPGSRFHVLYRLFGQRVPLEYEVGVYERPRRVVLAGQTARVRLHDEIHVAPRDGGSRVTYEARVELVGVPALADVLFQLAFEASCRRALRGLVAHAGELTRRRERAPRRAVAATRGA
jgi:Polyketide cyclase / dehydrase and lipid transport